MLLFITIRPPAAFPRRKLHRKFATFCADWTADYLIILEWSSSKVDPHGGSSKGDGEHFHAYVWVPDYDSFVSALRAWADECGESDKEKISPKARDWEILSGWSRYRDHGRLPDLRKNVARNFNYITKPPDNGARRDFEHDAIVSGAFETPWRRFCNETVPQRSVAATPWFCPICCDPHPPRTTGRPRIFCGNTCRSRANRNPWLRSPPAKWVVRFITSTTNAKRSELASSRRRG